MTEKEIIKRFKKDYKKLFPKIGKAALSFGIASKTRKIVDLSLRLVIEGQKKILLCEVTTQGYPKQLREKAFQLLEITNQKKIGYPVVIAPYISELGKDTCKKLGVGFLDLSGNAYIDFDSFYLEIEGKPNRFKRERGIESLFTPKAERVLRFYLPKTLPGGECIGNYRDIAKEISVSLGQVSKVNKKLDDLGFWIEEQKGLKTLDRKKLLDLWRENYRSDKNEWFSFYSVKQIPQIEKQIAEYCKKNKTPYAFTLFSGANRLAPFTRYNFASAYFNGNVGKLKKALDLKEVPSGANVQILLPYDEGLFYNSEQSNDVTVANPLQIYLELFNYKGRGKEQAEFLREKVLKF